MCFNPLPAPKYREILHLQALAATYQSFNPLPAPKYREIRRRWRGAPRHNVSIHSLHRSTGRYIPMSDIEMMIAFQSTPCTEVQGDRARVDGYPSGMTCFNPLPAPKYREINLFKKSWFISYVSIHSLHRSTGRYYLGMVSFKMFTFQSTPCTEVQGDPPRPAHRPHGLCFNPLPAPKYREIQHTPLIDQVRACFNPLPAPKYREMSGDPSRPISNRSVSIHSLHRSTGRFRPALPDCI